MSENCYNEIFETIKSNLVPKMIYEQSQLEIENLKSVLGKTQADLQRIKSKYEEQILKNEIIQAEKESLEAEKKTFELKFNEISLKLKLKTNQYDSLLSSRQTDCNPSQTGSQTAKEEPNEIEIASSIPENGAKRTSLEPENDKSANRRSKRKKIEKFSQSFTCDDCLAEWGEHVDYYCGGDPDKNCAPDPKKTSWTFSSFEAFKNHKMERHHVGDEEPLCEDKGCLQLKGHSDLPAIPPYNRWTTIEWFAPHGEIICKNCDLSFKYQKHHDQHVETVHADNDMSNRVFYALYLQYKNSH